MPTGQAETGRIPNRLTSKGMAQADLNQLDGAYELLRGGGKLDERQTRLIESILTAATGHLVRVDKIISTVEKINSSNDTRDAALARIEKQVLRANANADVH